MINFKHKFLDFICIIYLLIKYRFNINNIENELNKKYREEKSKYNKLLKEYERRNKCQN